MVSVEAMLLTAAFMAVSGLLATALIVVWDLSRPSNDKAPRPEQDRGARGEGGDR